jgi:predicted nucleic acid-binding protein
VAFSESTAAEAADVAIGVTAVIRKAVLVTRNARDFAGIPGLETEATGRS